MSAAGQIQAHERREHYPRIAGLDSIFVAARSSFVAEVPGAGTERFVLDLCFRELPLLENGWSRDLAQAVCLRGQRWRVSRR